MAEKENLPFNRESQTRLIKRAEKYNINTIITTITRIITIMIIRGLRQLYESSVPSTFP